MPGGSRPQACGRVNATPTWEHWRLAGVLRDEAFPHPLAAGTASLPGLQPSSGGSLIVGQMSERPLTSNDQSHRGPFAIMTALLFKRGFRPVFK